MGLAARIGYRLDRTARRLEPRAATGVPMPVFGAIEAGGTKFVCAVGGDPHRLRAITQFPTTTPEETLSRAIGFLAAQAQETELEAIGIACFGPVDRSPTSPTYGRIMATPKPGWSWVDVAGTVSRALHLPVAIDTDTNGAALAEFRWGAAQGLDDFAYITIGTGIGAGLIVNGGLVHGLLHPEFGHIRIPHDLTADAYPGCCPFHGDCLEGLASGRALELRWRRSPETLPAGHRGWALEARYLALGIANLVCTLVPQRIVLGGGVMRRAEIWPLLRAGVQTLVAGYLALRELADGIETFIAPPGLGDRAGILGALALAASAARTRP
jgi:fructokinase